MHPHAFQNRSGGHQGVPEIYVGILAAGSYVGVGGHVVDDVAPLRRFAQSRDIINIHSYMLESVLPDKMGYVLQIAGRIRRYDGPSLIQQHIRQMTADEPRAPGYKSLHIQNLLPNILFSP
ncbi:hypothetical protein SDC9_145292 [bioreactor metagenome]|uniref:Uncharacterized protein n=1 Tax=bioreactor metagenome TaxID=1076179 RepID=A0A645E9K5_9ZZZZ